MKKNKDAQIYILAHRKTKIKENSLYTPLQIGASYTKKDIYPLKDNQNEDNISDLNPLCCDVCGIYYIYKNLLDRKYIGICGVRRYLDIKENEKFDDIFNEYDIILPTKFLLNTSTIEFYSDYHNKNDIDLVTDIIAEYFPEYLDTWKNLDITYTYSCYMMKKEIFEDYCDFLFGILNRLFDLLKINNLADVEKYVKDNYDKGLYRKSNVKCKTPYDMIRYQMNIAGFLQERILTLYVVYNNLKVLNRELIYTENYQTFVNYEED